MLLFLLACAEESKVPEGAVFYEITVEAKSDSCHPDSTEGYKDTFSYAIVYDGSSVDIWIDDTVFASGTASGCDLTYQTVVTQEETEGDGMVKWQLFGQAAFDAGDDACVASENDWEGTEYFEIVSSDDETLEPGCDYEMTTTGVFKGEGG